MSPKRQQQIKVETDELHYDYALSQIRRHIGFTQMEVARRLGISQPTYAEYEHGNNMRIKTLQKIVSALGGKLSVYVVIGNGIYDLKMPSSK